MYISVSIIATIYVSGSKIYRMNFFAFPLTQKFRYSRVYLHHTHTQKTKYKIVEKGYGRFLRTFFRCIRNNPCCKHFRFFKESRMK